MHFYRDLFNYVLSHSHSLLFPFLVIPTEDIFYIVYSSPESYWGKHEMSKGREKCIRLGEERFQVEQHQPNKKAVMMLVVCL